MRVECERCHQMVEITVCAVCIACIEKLLAAERNARTFNSRAVAEEIVNEYLHPWDYAQIDAIAAIIDKHLKGS